MMRTRAAAVVAAISLLMMSAPGVASAHDMDHPIPPPTAVEGPPSAQFLAGGIDGVAWELLHTFATGNPHTDLDFFTQGNRLYASVGTLAFGPNGGGQTIVQLMEDGDLAFAFVSAHPSATCLSAATGVTGLQHDVEATPKGNVMLNTDVPMADRRDAQLLLDATDARGRCHDNGLISLPGIPGLTDAPPNGGIEIIDIRNVSQPFEIALTAHAGEAHTINTDPKRPHIAYVSPSDFVGVDEDGEASVGSRTQSHAVEIIDLSSCLDLDPDASIQDRRDACRPLVYRIDWDPRWTSSVYKSGAGSCHETEIYPNDILACAGLDGTVLLDLSGAFDDNGTPDDFTDDTVRGTPLPCDVRASSSLGSPTGAMVIDCVNGRDDNGELVDLSVSGWQALGKPSAEGIELFGFVPHGGVAADHSDTVDTGPAFDIQIAHEAELTESGRFLIVSDERGGGVLAPGATCDPAAAAASLGNGGLHAFRVDDLFTELPDLTGDELALAVREQAYARTPDGSPAVVVPPARVPAPAFCTAHVFHQIPGQNRIFMGWYSQGTQVIDFVEHADGTFEFIPIAWFIPENANTWTSAIFHMEENADGSFTYYGATGDFILAGLGRNAIDVYSVTLPPPSQALVDAGQPAPDPAPFDPPSDGTTTPPMPATGINGTPMLAALLGLSLLGYGYDRRRQLGGR